MLRALKRFEPFRCNFRKSRIKVCFSVTQIPTLRQCLQGANEAASVTRTFPSRLHLHFLNSSLCALDKDLLTVRIARWYNCVKHPYRWEIMSSLANSAPCNTCTHTHIYTHRHWRLRFYHLWVLRNKLYKSSTALLIWLQTLCRRSKNQLDPETGL